MPAPPTSPGDAAIAAARRLWAAAEALHAVTYFHPACLDALAAAGAKGFWMGYFVGRMCPLGAAPAAVAEAVAFGFSPVLPARALPDGWDRVPPAVAERTRTAAAATALRGLDVPEPSPATLAALASLRDHGRAGGHALGAANRALSLDDDPWQRLWQLVTWLREQRGDDHVALWVAAGFDGCEANVLTTAVHGQDPDVLRVPRAWSPQAWAAAGRRLAGRGLVAAPAGPASDGSDAPTVTATEAGRALHAGIEARTDELSAALYARAPGVDTAALARDLGALAAPVLASGLYPSPNPMGLPTDPTR